MAMGTQILEGRMIPKLYHSAFGVGYIDDTGQESFGIKLTR